MLYFVLIIPPREKLLLFMKNHMGLKWNAEQLFFHDRILVYHQGVFLCCMVYLNQILLKIQECLAKGCPKATKYFQINFSEKAGKSAKNYISVCHVALFLKEDFISMI